jgi:L-cysteine desulfidase
MLMKEKQFLKELLVREVIPATGCTEAGAVALATGWAVQAYGGSTDEIEEITIEVDEGTYKNALGVGIPGTRETGLGFAAAMGASLSERAHQELQILENPTDEAIERARALIAKNRIRVIRLRDGYSREPRPCGERGAKWEALYRGPRSRGEFLGTGPKG